jgi:hypothetical protein
MLYYRESLRIERRQSAARLADVNAATASAQAANDRLRALFDGM